MLNLKDTASRYSNWLSQYPGYQALGNNYDTYPGFRFRRSQVRTYNGANYPRPTYLKRAHRTKRDLYYPLDALSDDYLPYEDNYIPYNTNTYNNYPVDTDDLKYLIEALSAAPEEDEEILNYESPYEGYYPGNYEVLNEEDDDDLGPYFTAPLKRQVGPAYMPGIKRSRDFYPSFREPWTHFQAFIPEKRAYDDYSDAYERVMELAAALRDQNRYYVPEQYAYEVGPL